MKAKMTCVAMALALSPPVWALGPQAIVEPPDRGECPPPIHLPTGEVLSFSCQGDPRWPSMVQLSGPNKLSVWICKSGKGKVPLKDCGGSIGMIGWSPGSLWSGNPGQASAFGSMVVDPIGGFDAMYNETQSPYWSGTIGGSSGPVPAPPGVDPWETPQDTMNRIYACQSTCNENFGMGAGACAVLGLALGNRYGPSASAICTAGVAISAPIACQQICNP